MRASTRLGIALTAVALLLLCGFEGYRAYAFYDDVTSARTNLLSLQSQLDLNSLQNSEAEILASRARLDDARVRTADAVTFVHTDPFLKVARHLPVIGKQVQGLTTLVEASQLAAQTGIDASDVALAFSQQKDNPSDSAIQQALVFLEDQKQPMARVQDDMQALQAKQATLPSGLFGPLGSASKQLGDSLNKLDGLVTGYNRAEALLPGLLGFDGARSYLVLPQNDTELFPSGGLISSYGIATFDNGSMGDIHFEYFEALYNRWQAATHEYVDPPAPLKQYLLHDYSWGLGEAGWFPDFPTTAGLASSFVQKGGAQATDGVIAIDLQFISALLGEFGSVYVPAYDVTVTPRQRERADPGANARRMGHSRRPAQGVPLRPVVGAAQAHLRDAEERMGRAAQGARPAGSGTTPADLLQRPEVAGVVGRVRPRWLDRKADGRLPDGGR